MKSKTKILIGLPVSISLFFLVSFAYAAAPDGSGPWADSVVSSSQGIMKNGLPVPAARSNPTAAVGVAENDTIDTHFFSLGFGGNIVLGFDNGISSGVFAVESTNPNYPLERASIEVSEDGTTWVNAGTVAQDGIVNVPAGISCAQFVRVTDISDPVIMPDDIADGYDVDGVQALGGPCLPSTPTPTSTPTTIFHFIKTICPSFANITGNASADLLDATGGKFNQFTNYNASSTPPFPSPYAFTPISPSEIVPSCLGAAGWQFKISPDLAQSNPTIIGPTDSSGVLNVPFADLPQNIQDAIVSNQSMWVSEVLQPLIASFGAMRCNNDAINGDNLESIHFASTTPDDVYCIAYNVLVPPVIPTTTPGDFTLTLTKSGNGNGTVSGSVNGASTTIFCDLDACDPSKSGQTAFVHTYASGTVVTLTPSPDASSNFDTGWAGDCTGTAPCTITITSNVSMDAPFNTTSQTGGGGGGGGGGGNGGGSGGGGAGGPTPAPGFPNTGGQSSCSAQDITEIPNIIQAVRVSPTSFFVSWEFAGNLNNFVVQYGFENGLWLYTTNVSGLFTTLHDLPENQPIWVRVAATDTCIVGPFAPPVLTQEIGQVNAPGTSNTLGTLIPGLPNTGLGPNEQSIPWNTPAAGVLSLIIGYMAWNSKKYINGDEDK